MPRQRDTWRLGTSSWSSVRQRNLMSCHLPETNIVALFTQTCAARVRDVNALFSPLDSLLRDFRFKGNYAVQRETARKDTISLHIFWFSHVLMMSVICWAVCAIVRRRGEDVSQGVNSMSQAHGSAEQWTEMIRRSDNVKSKAIPTTSRAGDEHDCWYLAWRQTLVLPFFARYCERHPNNEKPIMFS